MTLVEKGLLMPFLGVQMKTKFPTYSVGPQRECSLALPWRSPADLRHAVVGDAVLTSDFHIREEIFAACPIHLIKQCA